MSNKKFWELKGRLYAIVPDMTPEFFEAYLEIRRLAKKHHRIAEMECNGEGYLNGKFYTLGPVEGGKVNGYLNDQGDNVFDAASTKIEEKIMKLALDAGMRVEFQGDPRGATVQLYERRNPASSVRLHDKYIPILD